MKRITLLLALAICAKQSITAQTNVSGYILSNTTWTLANSPYIVIGNILVNNGVTLTIEPGVTVKFDTTKSLQIDGELIAIGNAQNRITFTATDLTPARGSWGRIQFSPTSTDAVFDTAGNYISGSILKYCDIRYGGGVPGDVTVYCDTAAPYFSNCKISDCLKDGIRIVKASGRVDSSSFRNCLGKAVDITYADTIDLVFKNDTCENNATGIRCYGPGSTTILNCNFTTHSGYALSIGSGYYSTVQGCTFTDSDTALNAGGDNSIIIQDCSFTNSTIALNMWSVENTLITNNSFTGNTNALSGDLGLNATISNNIFTGQTNSVLGAFRCASSDGSSRYQSANLYASNLTISNNHFENNKGGIYVWWRSYGYYQSYPSHTIIQGNTFLNNQFIQTNDCPSYYNPPVYSYGFVRVYGGSGVITNNVFDGNTSVTGIGDLINLNGQWEVANNIIINNAPGKLIASAKGNICANKFVNNTGTIIVSGSSSNSSTTFIHHNDFLNNIGAGTTISISGSNSIINNNEFRGNATVVNILSIGASTVSNNRFLNNQTGNTPIVSITGNSNIHHNDFLNNTGSSCLRISGNFMPTIEQNNINNPNVQYEIENQIPFGPGTNISTTNNYWGTTSTAHIDSVIKDYFDDANLSVVLYPPVLAAPAFVDTNASCSISTVCSLAVSGTVVNASCYGGANGSINTTLSSGTSPYTYFWSNGNTSQNSNNLTSGNYTVTVIDGNLCSATKSFVVGQPATPVTVVSGVLANANCNTGGSINISAGGGTIPYTYNWGSGITTQNRTGLNPGNYSVTVRDNYNCSTTQSFTVGQDAGPIISGVVTNTNCNNTCDGIINLSATGIAPFTYDWGSGFGTSADTTGLCAGTYNVTVADSNNCGISATFTITTPAAIIATASVTTDVSCFGFSDGAATAAAIGGTQPYSFLWSDGQNSADATALSAGTYDVIVTDSLGCNAPASVMLPDGNNVFVGVIGGPSSSSINQSETYIVSANFNYSYAWSVLNGILLSGQGTNSIEVAWTAAGTGLVELIAIEQGCSDTVSKSVTIVDTTQNCSALFYLYPDTIPHSYFVVNTASGIPQLTYSWNWGDGSAIDTTAYPSHTYAAAGFYTICLTITDSAGCTDTYCNPYFLLKAEDESSAMIQVNVYPPSFTGIQNEDLKDVAVYPNPASSSITITAPFLQTEATLMLADALGKSVLQKTVMPHELRVGSRIEMAALPEGIYFLQVCASSSSRVLKVIKY